MTWYVMETSTKYNRYVQEYQRGWGLGGGGGWGGW